MSRSYSQDSQDKAPLCGCHLVSMLLLLGKLDRVGFADRSMHVADNVHYVLEYGTL